MLFIKKKIFIVIVRLASGNSIYLYTFITALCVYIIVWLDRVKNETGHARITLFWS